MTEEELEWKADSRLSRLQTWPDDSMCWKQSHRLLSSAVRLERADPRSSLWGLYQPDPAGRLRGSVDPALQDCGAPLGVPAHDELQWPEPRLRLRQIRLTDCSDQRHPLVARSHAGARLLPECPPQHREETPVCGRPASHHQARGPLTGTAAHWHVSQTEHIHSAAFHLFCQFFHHCIN